MAPAVDVVPGREPRGNGLPGVLARTAQHLAWTGVRMRQHAARRRTDPAARTLIEHAAAHLNEASQLLHRAAQIQQQHPRERGRG